MLRLNWPITIASLSRCSFRSGVALASVLVVFTTLYSLIGTARGYPLDWEGLEFGNIMGEPFIHIRYPINGAVSKASMKQPVDWPARASMVKKAFSHAYSGYQSHAFPHDELLPLTNASTDQFNGWGVTVYDSLDTMLLMGLNDEFDRALSHVKQSNFSFQHKFEPAMTMNMHISFFETVIRYLGGMLSAYALSHNSILLQKADELAVVLAPAFESESGLPFGGFDASSGSVISASVDGLLAEVASCQLEYAYLAKLTGKTEHYDKSAKIFENLRKINFTLAGMIPTRLLLSNGAPSELSISVGAGADSGHEYLLKYYLMTAQTDQSALKMYMKTVNGALTELTYITPQRGLLYVTDILGSTGKPSHNMEHLSCFFPGLLALGIHTLPTKVFEDSTSLLTSLQKKKLSPYKIRQLHLWAAIGLGETCWQMYADQPTGLGIEVANMNTSSQDSGTTKTARGSGLWVDSLESWRVRGSRALPPGVGAKQPEKDPSRRDYKATRSEYLLRPETVESMYLLWKATGDERWRERGWAIFEAIEKTLRTNSGYATVKPKGGDTVELTNEMPSFFLAETLKYLYLLFLDKDPLPLDRWVFNTEAHPLPVFSWSSEEAHRFGIS